jgi:hypothetical protein
VRLSGSGEIFLKIKYHAFRFLLDFGFSEFSLNEALGTSGFPNACFWH